MTIVGHGPSILSGLGSVIDASVVIRLKAGLTQGMAKDSANWGSRTDYVVARSPIYKADWYFFDQSPDGVRWLEWYKQFNPRKWKPSCGLCAAMLAVDKLQPTEIALIGCDRICDPTSTATKWHKKPGAFAWGHDAHAENRAIHALGPRIIDLVREHEQAKA